MIRARSGTVSRSHLLLRQSSTSSRIDAIAEIDEKAKLEEVARIKEVAGDRSRLGVVDPVASDGSKPLGVALDASGAVDDDASVTPCSSATQAAAL